MHDWIPQIPWSCLQAEQCFLDVVKATSKALLTGICDA